MKDRQRQRGFGSKKRFRQRNGAEPHDMQGTEEGWVMSESLIS